MSFPSQTSFLAMVRDLAKKMSEAAGFDEGTAGKLALAVDEAATNVLEHAYQGKGDREVEIRFEDRGPELRVEILDTGERVERQAVPAVDLERYAREHRTGGLGVHLMEKIMDSVTYHRTPQGNVCSLVKRKEGAAASR